MTHIVVSNTGNWDCQMLGFVGVLKDHRDFRSFCDNKERRGDNSVPRSMVANGDDDTISGLLMDHEMDGCYDGVNVDMIVFPDDDYPNDDVIPNMYLMVSL